MIKQSQTEKGNSKEKLCQQTRSQLKTRNNQIKIDFENQKYQKIKN